ncbi:protein adenylyltransferase SelO-like [Diadema antillarum]|uniref:protein adenylyltransferase SelO-like n=1 Tax=Diadema antillarum TaxID=105358 RepID=UPI003A839C6B
MAKMISKLSAFCAVFICLMLVKFGRHEEEATGASECIKGHDLSDGKDEKQNGDQDPPPCSYTDCITYTDADRVSASCRDRDAETASCSSPSQGSVTFNRALVADIKEWNFPNYNSLRESFPIDPIEENYVRKVPRAVFSSVLPTPLKTSPRLVAFTPDVLQDILDLDPAVTEMEPFVAFVAGNTFLGGHIPLAHRYGGHQFGGWSGQLGDGRAHLLGEYMNSHGETWELQLKGSGKTPYSRHGDGRAVLRSSVREFLASEAMHHLGIPTSRALSLIVSEDPVWRDQFYDGHPRQEKAAVVLRLAPSWFRIGSLEILTYNGEIDLLRKLTDFIIRHYFVGVDPEHEDRYLAFFAEVVSQMADMIARWQSVGFAHGVMNTDNFSILSLTIDYGPFGFLDEYNPRFVPNTSDDEARYSYENQPDVGLFNLRKLAAALTPLLTPTQTRQLSQIVAGYADVYKQRFMELFRAKLGLVGSEDVDEYMVAALLKMMEDTKADFTMTFRQLGEVSVVTEDTCSVEEGEFSEHWALATLSTHEMFSEWWCMYAERLQQDGEYSDEQRRKQINAVNPKYILRNWMAQAAIERSEGGDYTIIRDLQRVLSDPFTDQPWADDQGYSSRPPAWASHVRVSCSS